MTHPHPRALEAAARALYDAGGNSANSVREVARAAVAAYFNTLHETHAIVPKEATVGMFRALTHSWPDDLQKGVWLLGSFDEDYRAMIDAAPPAAQDPRP